MPSDNDPAIGPPPLRTPFHEIPRTVPSSTLPTAEKVEQGNISRPWTNWLQQVYSGIVSVTQDFPFLTPEQFGAVGNGATDDTRPWTLVIAAAIDQELPIVASGTYLVRKQGTTVLPWDGLAHPYAFLVTEPITIYGAPTFTIDISDSETTNVFIFQLTSGVHLSNLAAVGTGTASTLKLYDGALLVFDRCAACQTENMLTTNMRGNTLFFQSTDCVAGRSFSSVPAANLAGSHFGSYGSSRITIRDCTGYGGTHDGDIVHFGTNAGNRATGNRIVNCAIYNYEFGDAAKTIVFNEAQGLLLDSGQEFGAICDSYAYGYFYGIDVKTTCTGSLVQGNTIEKCKVGIAARRGEGAAPLYDTQILGNIIRPMGGNGNLQDLFNGLTFTVGIWVQDARGATIADNLIEASWLFGSGEQDYIAIYGITTNSFPPLDSSNEGFLIVNNKFINEMNVAGFYTYTKNATVYLVGLANNLLMRGKVDGNDFKSFNGGTVTRQTVTVEYCSQFSISNNHFSRTVGDYQAVIVSNAVQLQVNDNTFAGAAGFISIATADSITIHGNHFGIASRNLSTALPVPVIYGSAVTHIVIDGNVQDQTVNGNLSNDDGRLFETSAAGNSDIVISNNVMSKRIFIVDWYQINAVSLNAATGIAVFGNVLNGTTVAATVGVGGTGVLTLAAHGVLIGAGASPVNVTGAGSAGDLLTSNGAGADPTFQPLGASLITASAGLRVIGQTDLTGDTIVAPNGAFGLSGILQVRNAAGTGFSSITVSGGLITAFAP